MNQPHGREAIKVLTIENSEKKVKNRTHGGEKKKGKVEAIIFGKGGKIEQVSDFRRRNQRSPGKEANKIPIWGKKKVGSRKTP